VAPANTPKDIIVRLNKEIVEILKDKESAEELLKQGAIPVADSPEEFAAYIKVEIAKWGAVVITQRQYSPPTMKVEVSEVLGLMAGLPRI
jgi:tripartite-type tricarboxylate transporter receptor subunit TctC